MDPGYTTPLPDTVTLPTNYEESNTTVPNSATDSIATIIAMTGDTLVVPSPYDLPTCKAELEGLVAYAETLYIYLVCTNSMWIEITPIGNPDESYGDSVCGGAMWCGGPGGYNVNTGLDNVSGFWFFYTDTSSGGNSEFTWPVDPYDKGWDALINSCGGICGKATLGDGYMYPYMGVGFVVANDDTGESSDITDWGGICVTYSADKPMRIAIHPKDSVQQLLDYDDYRTELPPGTNVTANVPWSGFHQDGWGTPYDQALLLTQIETVIFVYQDGSWYDAATFSITKIGKLGTCN